MLQSPVRVLFSGSGALASNGKTVASLCGYPRRLNQYLYVSSFKTWYQPQVSDIIVGRITKLRESFWLVDVKAGQEGKLNIAAVNLPGGELRRRSAHDERNMRQYFVEGDVLSAEVQQVHANRSFTLHTRSDQIGKLEHGVLVDTLPSLIGPGSKHIHNIGGVGLIIGANGRCWVSGPRPTVGHGDSTRDKAEASLSKERMVAVSNVVRTIKRLTKARQFITADSIRAGCAAMEEGDEDM